MQTEYISNLGSVVKSARLEKQLTRKQLAEKLQVSSRHLTAIENEKQQPSYELLYILIRELQISSDLIFYPEKSNHSTELDLLHNLLKQCDNKEINIIRSTVQSMLDNETDME